MDIGLISTATEDGKLNWYSDTAVRGANGEVETNYLCSLQGYEIDVSLVHKIIVLKKDGIQIDDHIVESDVTDLITKIEAFITSKKTEDLTSFVDVISSI
jgi:hypothetical protein